MTTPAKRAGGPARGASTHSSSCGCHRCRGFWSANAAARKHGLTASTSLVPLVDEERERLLERMELAASELTWIAHEALTNYARAVVKLNAADEWIAEHGLFDADGESPAPMRWYWTAHRAATKALAELRAVVGQAHRLDDLEQLAAAGRRVREARESA